MSEKLAKICITADPDVVSWIDKMIEKRVYRNRSHAFDVAGHLLKESIEGDSSPKEAAIEVTA